MKICHMTSAHPPEDIRIFVKECVSLAKAGHEVFLVEQGETYEKDGVHIVGIGSIPSNRKVRMTKVARAVYNTAISINADVYHFHDPELLPYAIRLKRQKKKVIFDSHEDVPAQIIDKTWIPGFLRKIVSICYKCYETYVVKRIDAVVAATLHIGNKFQGRAKKVVVVNNYPKLDDITFHDKPFSERDPIICYAGVIKDIRGEKIMVEAMKDVNGVLVLAGDHVPMNIGNNVSFQ